MALGCLDGPLGAVIGMAPGEIDRYVRAQLAAGADLYTLHARALADLAPDLILTQDLCRVGARRGRWPGCPGDVLPGHRPGRLAP